MIFGSVCSGIEAASQAWAPLGWTPEFFAEIEPFPCEVLAHHHGSNMPGGPLATNGVPNLGDIKNFKEWPDYAIDVLVGGTPCQDYSMAGPRAGMAGDRGGLTLTYIEIAARYRPRWAVWENVPGVLSSNNGRDFARFLGDLSGTKIERPKYGWKNSGIVEGISDAYGLAYRVLDAQYVRVDGARRAVPQRRRRVFVVGYLGDWRRAAAVLFEPESLRGDSPPRREAGESVGPPPSARTQGGGGLVSDAEIDGGLIPGLVASEHPYSGTVSTRCAKGSGGPSGDECQNLVAHTLRGCGSDASEDGTGRGVPIVPVAGTALGNSFVGGAGGRQDGAVTGHFLPIAFSSKDHGADATVDVAPTLRASGHDQSHANGGAPPAVAFDLRGREQGAEFEGPHDTANIRAASGGSSRSYVAVPWAVRRLTPRECERLQDFPDDFTRIPWGGKPAEECPDGHRYEALGNSMAVNVMRWIGRRIEMVEALS